MRQFAATVALAIVVGFGSASGASTQIPPNSSSAVKSIASDSAKRRDSTLLAKRADSIAMAQKMTAQKDSLGKLKIDSLDLKQLPPRALPLKQQMMFAGGFMIFLALMMTSMQNFNPND